VREKINNNNICIRSFIVLKLKERNVGFNIKGKGMKNSTFSHIYYQTGEIFHSKVQL
jgi:hypothetical protein